MPPARYWGSPIPGWRYIFTSALTGRRQRGMCCAEAIVASANHFCEKFARSSSSYLQRALDVRDVCSQYSSKSTVSNASRHRQLTQPAI
ncbi:hypothetical protein ACNKHP_14830 [Shigella boydii]